MVYSAPPPPDDDKFDCEDEETFLPSEQKQRKLWGKAKYELIDYDALPEFLKDNDYILHYYRSEWPIKEVLLSIFTIHNETLNIWTHLIGFFLFLALTIYTATKVPDVFGSIQLNCLPPLPSMPDFDKLRDSLPSFDSVLEHLSNCIPDRNFPSNQTNDQYGWDMKEVMDAIAPALHPITRWPFYAFLGGAMFCLLASSACHLLSCHSERLSYIMLRFDYAGIAALITTSFYPPVYYSFVCNHFLRNLYLTFITVLGIITIIFSLFPCFQSPAFRSIRASLFFGMGVSGAAPIFHKLILYWDQPEALQTTGYELLMGALYGFGALIYATRIPERWMPGKVDLAGHSHQIFHVLVVAGAFTHYCSGLIYLKWRDLHGCN